MKIKKSFNFDKEFLAEIDNAIKADKSIRKIKNRTMFFEVAGRNLLRIILRKNEKA